jgi:hypothetical protein
MLSVDFLALREFFLWLKHPKDLSVGVNKQVTYFVTDVIDKVADNVITLSQKMM